MDLKERNENMRTFFNRKIDSYDEVHQKFIPTKNQITENLKNDTKKVLDLGAGTGLELIKLYEVFPEAHVTAIDISESMLKSLKNRDFSSKLDVICGDFFEVDFGSNYDAVISTSALHHFLREDKIRLYKKIYDCLKPDGLFINSDKVAFSLEEEVLAIEDYNKNKDIEAHIDTPLAPETEVEILKEVGFKNVEIKDADADNYRLIIATK